MCLAGAGPVVPAGRARTTFVWVASSQLARPVLTTRRIATADVIRKRRGRPTHNPLAQRSTARSQARDQLIGLPSADTTRNPRRTFPGVRPQNLVHGVSRSIIPKKPSTVLNARLSASSLGMGPTTKVQRNTSGTAPRNPRTNASSHRATMRRFAEASAGFRGSGLGGAALMASQHPRDVDRW